MRMHIVMAKDATRNIGRSVCAALGGVHRIIGLALKGIGGPL